MTVTSSTHPLDILHAAGIITAEHRRRALADPSYDEFRVNRGLIDPLLWMRVDNIIDEQVLEQAEAHVTATYTGDERACYLEAIEAALGLVLESDELQRVWFRQLLGAKWITQDECDRALAAIGPEETVARGPGDLLAWMAGKGIVGPDRLAEVRIAGNPAGEQKMARMLENLEWVLSEPARRRRKRVFKVAGVLVAGLLAWAIFRPAPAPGCSEDSTRRTIEQLLLGPGLDKIDAPALRKRVSEPTVKSLDEVSYASTTRVRACKATVELDGEQVPYAFTIAPAVKGKNVFVVSGFQPVTPEARKE